MIAVLLYVDGFTEVEAIYPTLKIAKQHYFTNFSYQEFDFGTVTFAIYDAQVAYPNNRQRR